MCMNSGCMPCCQVHPECPAFHTQKIVQLVSFFLKVLKEYIATRWSPGSNSNCMVLGVNSVLSQYSTHPYLCIKNLSHTKCKTASSKTTQITYTNLYLQSLCDTLHWPKIYCIRKPIQPYNNRVIINIVWGWRNHNNKQITPWWQN